VSRKRSSSPVAKGMTRDRILDAASRLIGELGESGLSMRNVATELGVATTTIYWHVGNREALLDALIERVVATFDLDDIRGNTPHERLKVICVSLRRSILDNAVIVELATRENRFAKFWVAARDACLREIRSAGLQGADAVRALQTILIHVIGFVRVERSFAIWKQEHHATEGTGVAGLPVADDELAVHMAAPVDADALFEFSVEILLAGALQPTAATTTRARKAPGRSRPRLS